VSVSALSELRGIHETSDGGLRLGALVTLSELAKSPLVTERYPLLARAAASAASPQLRNQGTLGGNLCQRPRCWYFRGDFPCLRKGGDVCFAMAGESHYHAILGGDGCYAVHPSDTAPALVALRAQVHTVGPDGRRTRSLESLFVSPSQDPTRETALEPGELLAEVLLPPPWPGLRGTYRKLRERGAWDFALVGIAVALRTAGQSVEDARVALGGVAPIPWRSRPMENALIGRPLAPETAAVAAATATEGAEPLEHNGYKLPLLRGAAEDALLGLTAPAPSSSIG
jgi:xanthine dehydrogenase YagS FAD-binding subunit